MHAKREGSAFPFLMVQTVMGVSAAPRVLPKPLEQGVFGHDANT